MGCKAGFVAHTLLTHHLLNNVVKVQIFDKLELLQFCFFFLHTVCHRFRLFLYVNMGDRTLHGHTVFPSSSYHLEIWNENTISSLIGHFTEE